jgi:hypothetical protein
MRAGKRWEIPTARRTHLASAANPNVAERRPSPARTYAIAPPLAMPEVSATAATEMATTAAKNVAATTKMAATEMATTTVTTAAVAATPGLRRHISYGHNHAGHPGSRKAIHPDHESER